LKEGKNPAARPIRINFDEIRTTDKGMKYYATMTAMQKATHATMRAYGFLYHKNENTGVSFFHCKRIHRLLRTKEGKAEGSNTQSLWRMP